jgi:hypothetical protein
MEPAEREKVERAIHNLPNAERNNPSLVGKAFLVVAVGYYSRE